MLFGNSVAHTATCEMQDGLQPAVRQSLKLLKLKALRLARKSLIQFNLKGLILAQNERWRRG